METCIIETKFGLLIISYFFSDKVFFLYMPGCVKFCCCQQTRVKYREYYLSLLRRTCLT